MTMHAPPSQPMPRQKRALGEDEIARALNEWMRKFIEEPSAFSREWETATRFMTQDRNGITPTYGEESVAFMIHLLDGLPVKASA